MELIIDTIDSPIGNILIVSDGARLCALDFADCESRIKATLAKRYRGFTSRHVDDPQGFSGRLRAYFAGDLGALDEIPADPGGTPFQHRVWKALRKIRPGGTLAYGDLAAKIGEPKASRAVGLANSLNPVAIVVPCHRVIGADGTLTGYGGGLERKRWLLQHEGVQFVSPNRCRTPGPASAPLPAISGNGGKRGRLAP